MSQTISKFLSVFDLPYEVPYDIARKLRSPLRYPGGKSKALDHILPHFPNLKDFDEYREPFLGGGSVALEVTKRYPHLRIWVNDLYWPLYNFWVQLRDRGEELSQTLQQLKQAYPPPDKERELFAEARRVLCSDANNFQKAIYFWVINKCTFSGLSESGAYTQQNRFTFRSIANLEEYSCLIQNWQITNLSYEELLSNDPRTLVYLDPPYDLEPVNSRLYGSNGKMHKGFNHEEFAQWCDKSKSPMMVSYNADKTVMDRFPNWRQVELTWDYSMRSSGNYRSDQVDRKELLMMNF